ncbi:MAG: hypothetical protein DRP76_00555 [Candidatus Omnitrophota bacterium]|nr:MAG: hypothetical protein DRP76_00555 [Candidatus Omnitrophota bacterium]
MYKNEVNIAFEILVEEIENVIENLNQEGQKAFKNGRYDKAKEIIENVTQMISFREKVCGLQREWKNIFTGRLPKKIRRKRKGYQKLKRGLRTPQDEYIIPILQTLVELGGKAEMYAVLKGVFEKMKDRLNQYDMQALPSNPSQKRWENTAQWSRNTMVKEGLLSSKSPRGIWEITAAGRRFLSEHVV